MSDLQQRLQAIMSSFDEKVASLSQAQESMQDLQGYARSADGAIEVSVAPSGAVLDLRFGLRAENYTLIQLQQLIMEAIRTATADATQQMNETLEPILGDQMSQFVEGASGASVTAWKTSSGEEEVR